MNRFHLFLLFVYHFGTMDTAEHTHIQSFCHHVHYKQHITTTISSSVAYNIELLHSVKFLLFLTNSYNYCLLSSLTSVSIVGSPIQAIDHSTYVMTYDSGFINLIYKLSGYHLRFILYFVFNKMSQVI